MLTTRFTLSPWYSTICIAASATHSKEKLSSDTTHDLVFLLCIERVIISWKLFCNADDGVKMNAQCHFL